MQELLTTQQVEELMSGRLYIMDNRPEPQADEQTDIPPAPIQEEAAQEQPEPPAPRAVRRAYRDSTRPFVCALSAAVGIIAGVVIALFFPQNGFDITQSVTAQSGSFGELLLQRLLHTGGFLLAEYALGYFAAGSAVVWLVPLFFGLGAGLSTAGICVAGGSALVILPQLAYTLLLVAAAGTSGELSAMLLRLVSGESSSVVTRGRASHRYDLQFGAYLLAMLAVAIAEAAARAA